MAGANGARSRMQKRMVKGCSRPTKNSPANVVTTSGKHKPREIEVQMRHERGYLQRSNAAAAVRSITKDRPMEMLTKDKETPSEPTQSPERTSGREKLNGINNEEEATSQANP